MPADETFGAWIKARRSELDLTRESLAERVGCAVETIRKIERGQRRPSIQMAELLAVHLRIPAEQLEAFVRRARGQPEAGPGPAMPARLTPLVGREADLEAAISLVRRPHVRLLTLWGPPGVGKTRLALALGEAVSADFSDGTVFAEVAPANGPGGLMGGIARSLGLRDVPFQSPAAALGRHFGLKHKLLILDNFEEAAAAAPELLALLSSAPRLKILVTSRVALNVAGEHRWEVSPLSVAAAAVLFRERAEASVPSLVVTEADAPMVETVCRALDCLPLAIELAAARLRLSSLADLAGHLGLGLSAAGRRDLPERHATLREAIGWSYGLLKPAEQALFRRCAVLAGDGDYQAICALTDLAPEQVEDALLSLLDASLVQTGGESGGRRFGMLSLVRAYALEKLGSAGEESDARDRHLAYFQSLAETAGREWQSRRRGHWLRRLRADDDNLNAALDWARRTAPASFAHMAGLLGEYWHGAGLWRAGRTWLGQANALSGASAEAAARALRAEGVLAWAQCDLPAAVWLLTQAAGVYQRLEMVEPWAYSLVWLGIVTAASGHFDGGLGIVDQARVLFEEAGDARGQAFALTYAGALQMRAGQAAGALASTRRAEGLWRTLADDWGLAGVLLILASLALMEGDLDLAEARLREGLPLARQAGDVETLHSLEASLAYAVLCRGESALAGQLLQPALEFFTRQGTDPAAMSMLNVLAGAVARSAGRSGQARQRFTECLALNTDLREIAPVFWSLAGLAGLALADGDVEQAARLWSAADSIRPEPLRNVLGLPLSESERGQFENDRAALAGLGARFEWTRDRLAMLIAELTAA